MDQIVTRGRNRPFSGSLAMLAAMRRASSRVKSFAAARRPELVLEIDVGERAPPSARNRLRPYPKDMSAIDPLAVRSLERLAFDPNISFQLVTFVLPALPW